MNKEQLNETLRLHKKWVGDSELGKKADLSDADLSDANLRYADLRDANLRYADLRYADLRYANLRYADLRYANLRCADLRDANLRCADLRDANLRCADLRDANLRRADINRAVISGANGIMLLPVQDHRGYNFAHAIECDDGWRIRVACRDFTIDEALEHWGDDYEGEREQGDLYLYAVEWLKAKVEKLY